MESEAILEKLLEKGHQAYKKAIRKNCPLIARMLDRKETVEFQNNSYSCWTELILDCMGNLIQEELPHSQCIVTLDMNNSTIEVDLTDEDEKIIQEKLSQLI